MDSLRLLNRDEADADRRAGRVLRWALEANDRVTPPSASAAGLVDLADRAEFHRVGPLLHLAAAQLEGLDPAVAARLRSRYHAAVHRHLFTLDDLRWVDEVLAPLDAPWLVVKGPVLSEVIYRRPDHRTYADLDLVMPGDRLGRAVELLCDAGAELIAADWAALTADRHGEIQVLLPSQTVVDLHWHLVAIGHVRDRFRLSMPDLFRDAREVDLAGRRYRTLSVDHTIAHLALHAVLSGGNRLGWVKDLEQAITTQAPDWPAVGATARTWGAAPALAVQLLRGRRLVGDVVPDEALAAVASGRSWAAAVGAADRLQPLEESTGGRSAARVLAWSTAATTARSVAGLATVPVRWLGRRLGPDVRGRDTAAPAPEAWRAFLAMVAEGR